MRPRDDKAVRTPVRYRSISLADICLNSPFCDEYIPLEAGLVYDARSGLIFDAEISFMIMFSSKKMCSVALGSMADVNPQQQFDSSSELRLKAASH